MIRRNYKNLCKVLAIGLALALNLLYFPVHAASLTVISDTMSRLKVSETSDHTVKFTTPSGIQNGDTITLTFPAASFTMGASLTGVTIADGAGADNAVTSAAWSAPTLTITASSSSVVAGGNVATIKIPNAQITNPSSANTYIISIAGTFADTGSIAVVIVTDDQVVLTASVDPSITFSLSANTSSFGTLAPGVVDTAGTTVTLTVGTNGNGGYLITVRDAGNGANPGLYNSVGSAIIGSADASYNATGNLDSVPEGYGLQAACTAGCTTVTHVASDFRQATNIVGGVTRTNKNLVTYASPTSTDHTITNTYKAKASASTKAGSYTDTLTYIATATF